MISNPAAGVRIKVERAKEHIRNLEGEIAAFYQRNPYAAIAEHDPQTGEWVVRAEIREQPPLRWGAVSGDTIHNLRAALDNLWYLPMFPDGRWSEDRKTQFPIFDSFEEFEARRNRQAKSSRKPAVDILKAIKPYKGGNDALWLLHKLDIIDKHKALIPAYTTTGVIIFDISSNASAAERESLAREHPDWTGATPIHKAFERLDPLCPVEDGAELWRISPDQGLHMDMNPKLIFEVAFGEAEIIKGHPILPTLHHLTEVVDNIVHQFLRLSPS